MRRNHRGYRVGECHQRALRPDWAVVRARELREKDATLWTLPVLAAMFDVGVATVRDWCDYSVRP